MGRVIVRGFMDKVDFDHELEGATQGTRVYPSEEDVLKARRCAVHCGIVEVEVRLYRVVREESPEPGSAPKFSKARMDHDAEMIRLSRLRDIEDQIEKLNEERHRILRGETE